MRDWRGGSVASEGRKLEKTLNTCDRGWGGVRGEDKGGGLRRGGARSAPWSYGARQRGRGAAAGAEALGGRGQCKVAPKCAGAGNGPSAGKREAAGRGRTRCSNSCWQTGWSLARSSRRSAPNST
jgi:hypothetical protein